MDAMERISDLVKSHDGVSKVFFQPWIPADVLAFIRSAVSAACIRGTVGSEFYTVKGAGNRSKKIEVFGGTDGICVTWAQ